MVAERVGEREAGAGMAAVAGSAEDSRGELDRSSQTCSGMAAAVGNVENWRGEADRNSKTWSEGRGSGMTREVEDGIGRAS